MREIWKTIEGFKEKYQVSNHGRFRSNQYGDWRLLKTPTDSDGYPLVGPTINNKRTHFRVSKLVLLTFEGPPPTKFHQAAHLNGTRTDNRLENLVWATAKENHSHRKLHGTWPLGTKNGRSKLTPSEVIHIRKEKEKGRSLISLAEEYQMSISGIHGACTKNWRHL